MHATTAAIHDPQRMRHADAELLSLALIDARNHTLRWLAAFESHPAAFAPSGLADPPLWLVGHAAWFQEIWIARNVQCQRGESADPAGARLASIEPRADGWFDPACADRGARWRLALPDTATLRQYLADTLEATLDLLSGAEPSDQGLYFYRLALRREDIVGESLAAAAQALQLETAPDDSPWPPRPARATREALWFPAQHLALGSPPGGLVPPNERWAHDEAVLEFEIDAQALSWARFAEFAADGGYDDPRWWTREGWAWAQAEERRAPRYVEQLRGSVVVQRQGQMRRVGSAQAAVHVSRHEAEAWCRWAGRRLPTEPEWELAALGGGPRGFAFGDVFEWVAGSARAWSPDAAAAPGFAPMPPPGKSGVLRGASWVSRARCRHPRARRLAAPFRDDMFCGFRSCAA